ncbi:M18 family aminopeptidase [Amphritea sp. 1_MG-2023]|uniref:M18 family aminopeptidase n=1 Tax=Amphritea sp. 1_MG-2023 TaxID=3062670 RepID=UPI0026E13E3A|nr:M18 family aminopeptidase [Amphritea sp. 1_MG-2023]MDO6561805.1 M18 family aminopeptidase [Amphritea sp. 1_MG-2023]
MQKHEFNQQLFEFLAASPTPFHAVYEMRGRLQEAGYIELQEQDIWNVRPGGRYFIVRNESSIIAWNMGVHADLMHSGMRMVGAHTDSPCLKVKPNPEIESQGCLKIGVEVYGGALLNPWFDRDLSLAGRVNYLSTDGSICSELINFKRPIAVIPNLAIHLNREVNQGLNVNPQTDLPPIMAQLQGDTKMQLCEVLKNELLASHIDDVAEILDYELCFYDVQQPAYVGLNNEFFAAARLDNLLSCFIGMQALIESDSEQSCLLVCNDHEEVGSMSAAGAQGPMLKQLLQRILPDPESRSRMIAHSMMVSVDNAHAVHPNFADKHDSNHGPRMNAGAVIKINANQRYASNSETSALFRHIAQQEDVTLQSFVVRSDMGCGSTIGPITAAELGVKTVDIGVPQLAMHSIRELAGSDDPVNLAKVLRRYFQQEKV